MTIQQAVGKKGPVPQTLAPLARLLRTAVCVVVFTMLLVSFNPFPAEILEGQGVASNQIGYTLLGVLVLLSHVFVTDRRVLPVFASPWWVLLLLPLPLSLLPVGMPAEQTRAMAFTLTVMVIATGVFSLPPSIGGFRFALFFACSTVLVLSYAGIVFLPLRAIHQAYEVEWQHAGLWRGIYAHKNIAGPVMAVVGFAGIYLFRCGRRIGGAALVVFGLFFLLKTGSKTSMALVPTIAVLVILGPLIAGRRLTALVLFCGVTGLLALTLGSVVFPVFGKIVQDLLPGTTFSGRTDLWRFALDTAGNLPLTGYGYGNFWGTPLVVDADKPYWLAWDMRGAAHAHNSYLDIALQLGWPAVFTTLTALLVVPLFDYIRCRPSLENRRLSDFFLMVLGFTLQNACLESFFFHRDEQAWTLLWISVMGLRFCRKLTLRE